MNRKSVIAILLAVSIIINLLLAVFAFVQKAAADTARQEALNNAEKAQVTTNVLKAELDYCESLKEKAEKAQEECELRVIAFSNKK